MLRTVCSVHQQFKKVVFSPCTASPSGTAWCAQDMVPLNMLDQPTQPLPPCTAISDRSGEGRGGKTSPSVEWQETTPLLHAITPEQWLLLRASSTVEQEREWML